jgi:mannose-6-phosphate isomerase-like protein (cupin superfamily)
MNKVNFLEKFAQFDDYWQPRIVGELNDQQVKVVKLKGEFVWHHHDVEDELFLILKGSLIIQFRERDILLEEGEILVIPRGIEHRPVAEDECWVMLFEPAGTLNTGNVQDEKTVAAPEVI